MSRNQLRALSAFAALVAVVLIALPVLGVDPSPSPSAEVVDPSSAPASVEPSVEPSESAAPASTEPPPAATTEPEPAASPEPAAEPEENEQGNGGKPDKADKQGKGPKTPEHPVTLTGVVGQPEAGEYTLVVGVKVYQLSAGPTWWWGDANPLAGSVGKIVTVDGEQAEGSDEVDVLAIDGTAVRAAGKPPWAGGWKVVGEKHPGWAQWKVDKINGRGAGHGRDTAPGQLKQGD